MRARQTNDNNSTACDWVLRKRNAYQYLYVGFSCFPPLLTSSATERAKAEFLADLRALTGARRVKMPGHEALISTEPGRGATMVIARVHNALVKVVFNRRSNSTLRDSGRDLDEEQERWALVFAQDAIDGLGDQGAPPVRRH